ncbi:MAG: HNH endonuclease [Chloroflexi bacterium]|nr:HNH endonuclease [Chloroflexota bacterium]
MSSFLDSTSISPTITIQLTQGYVAIIDAADADIAQFKWTAHLKKGRDAVYAYRHTRTDGGKIERIFLHRLILCRMMQRTFARGELVDHINRDGLDCRRANLRVATPSQNQANRKIRKDAIGGLKGAVWDKSRGKWQAKIRAFGKNIFLGRYETAIEAHQAYMAAARQYFGEFACDGKAT